MTLALQGGRVRYAISSRDDNPLRHFRWAVPRLKTALRMFTADEPIDELAMVGPNKGGKTTSKAAWVLACTMKLPELDGVPVPQWRGPIEAAQLSIDYKAQLLSVKPAYLKLLGAWPHSTHLVGEALQSIRVMPLNGDPLDESRWSVIHFLTQENRTTGVGVRADVIDFDEPAVMAILRELRKAAHAGRRCIILHGFTPTKRREWAPVREAYGDSPRRSIKRLDKYTAIVRWSLDEVSDQVLTPAEKQKQWDRYQGDALFGDDGGARWHGDYMDTDASSPWGAGTAGLLAMFAKCRDPELIQVPVMREAHEDGTPTQISKVQIEIFATPKAGAEYYVPIDPASGVDDGHHNPAGLHIHEVGSNELAVRWNGFLAPFSLGVLAATLARQYNHALIDIEMKDHWGVNVVLGCHASGYFNLRHETRELRPGEWSKEKGFDMNEETRAVIIGCIQEWLNSAAAGNFYSPCPSRKVLECLADMRLDDRGRIVAGEGIAHAEDAILQGQSLRRAFKRYDMDVREPEEALTPEQLAWRKMIEEARGDEGPDVGMRPRFERARV
jgi:hypothetical protein